MKPRLSTFSAVLLMAGVCHAQTATPNPSSAPQTPGQIVAAAVLPTVDASTLPAKFAALGGGLKSGAASGWVNACMKATGPVYACFAEDLTAGQTRTRVGVETVFYHWQDAVYLSAKANAGIATANSPNPATGGAYGVGGSALVNLSRLKLAQALHVPVGSFLVVSATYDYSTLPDFGAALSKGVRPALGGGTYRFGFGKAWN